MDKPYRVTVGAIVVRDGLVLVCENKGGQWQFPQGGVEAGESLEDALFREVFEETGLKITSFVDPGVFYCYEWAPEVSARKPWCGSETHLFVVYAEGAVVLDGVEFFSHEWLTPEGVVSRLSFPALVGCFEKCLSFIR